MEQTTKIFTVSRRSPKNPITALNKTSNPTARPASMHSIPRNFPNVLSPRTQRSSTYNKPAAIKPVTAKKVAAKRLPNTGIIRAKANTASQTTGPTPAIFAIILKASLFSNRLLYPVERYAHLSPPRMPPYPHLAPDVLLPVTLF